MTINIQKELLLEKLNLASRFISSKISSISNLQGICLKGEKNFLNICATNLSQYYLSKIKIDNEKDFLIVIEPKKIIEFLSLLPTGKIELKIQEEKIVLTQKNIKGEFLILKEKDFPFPPEIKEKKQTIKTDFFKKNLPLVLFCASSDETRPVLTGVNFVVEDENIIIVSTDGFRLSMMKIKKDINLPSIIIPAKFLNDILFFLKNEEEVNFYYSNEEKMIVFETNENRFFSRLIEGEFPPFEKVIPSQINTTIIANKEEFLRNIKLVSVFSREFSNIVVLKTKNNNLIFQPKIDNQEKEVAIQEVKTKGEEIKIAFNFKFLLDFLSRLSSEEIIIELVRPDAPAVFKPSNEENFLHIIMPVRIQE